MKENIRNDRNDDQLNNDQDQLRPNTTNEVIREVNGDPDMDLNELSTSGRGSNSNQDTVYGSDIDNTDATQGMSWNPNDASAVRSGGTADMDDQTSGGAGLNTGTRSGAVSHITQKKGTTGSDFDGQNASS